MSAATGPGLVGICGARDAATVPHGVTQAIEAVRLAIYAGTNQAPGSAHHSITEATQP